MAGYAYIVLAALLWSTIGPAARVALDEGVAPLEISFWRAVIAGGCFAAHAVALRRVRLARRDLPGILGFAVFGVSVFYWSYFQAVEAGGAALAAVLLYTAPAWVAIASVLWLGERMTGRKAAALALTVGGVALVAAGGSSAALRIGPGAIALGLLSGLAYAVYYVFGKRYFGRYAAATLFAYTLPLGALLLLPAVDFGARTPRAWLALAFVALVPTYAAYLCYSAGLQRVEATRAATLATLEPVAAAVLAYVTWGERFTTIGYAGAALVLAGVVIVTAEPGAPEPPHEGPAPPAGGR